MNKERRKALDMIANRVVALSEKMDTLADRMRNEIDDLNEVERDEEQTLTEEQEARRIKLEDLLSSVELISIEYSGAQT